jgi:hypothetical protein
MERAGGNQKWKMRGVGGGNGELFFNGWMAQQP